jgi:molybdopterin converting factor small subunit
VSAEAGTVREVIAALGVSHPALAAQLLDEAGNLRSFINLYANEDSIKELNGLDTVLKSGDDLSIVPAIAGG